MFIKFENLQNTDQEVLRLISAQKELNRRQLSKALDLSERTIGRILERLSSYDLIDLKESKIDSTKRQKLYSLTSEGRKLFLSLENQDDQDDCIIDVFDRLESESSDQVIELDEVESKKPQLDAKSLSLDPMTTLDTLLERRFYLESKIDEYESELESVNPRLINLLLYIRDEIKENEDLNETFVQIAKKHYPETETFEIEITDRIEKLEIKLSDDK